MTKQNGTSTGLLKKAFDYYKVNNPSFSLRQLAIKLNINASHLTRIFSGKKPASEPLVEKLKEHLNIDEKLFSDILLSLKTEALQKKFTNTNIDNTETNTANENPTDFELVPSSAEWILSKWYRIAILDLITCTNFVDTDAWISKKLNVSLENVQASLKILEQEGLIAFDITGKRKKRYSHIRFPATTSKQLFRDYHSSLIEKSLKELDFKQNKNDFNLRLIQGITVACNPKNLAQAKEILTNALIKASEVLTDGDCTEVYQINMQLFPLTRPN